MRPIVGVALVLLAIAAACSGVPNARAPQAPPRVEGDVTAQDLRDMLDAVADATDVFHAVGGAPPVSAHYQPQQFCAARCAAAVLFASDRCGGDARLRIDLSGDAAGWHPWVAGLVLDGALIRGDTTCAQARAILADVATDAARRARDDVRDTGSQGMTELRPTVADLAGLKPLEIGKAYYFVGVSRLGGNDELFAALFVHGAAHHVVLLKQHRIVDLRTTWIVE